MDPLESNEHDSVRLCVGTYDGAIYGLQTTLPKLDLSLDTTADDDADGTPETGREGQEQAEAMDAQGADGPADDGRSDTMKVLQLSHDGDPGHGFDLHPQVTVVRGLDATQRAWFIDALSGLPEGRAEGVGGQVEAHGVRFDLHAATLELLELHSTLDVVVAPDKDFA